MSKASEILDKYEIQSQGDYLKKDVLAAMKEVASEAFDAGRDNTEKILDDYWVSNNRHAKEVFLKEKNKYIDKLFGE